MERRTTVVILSLRSETSFPYCDKKNEAVKHRTIVTQSRWRRTDEHSEDLKPPGRIFAMGTLAEDIERTRALYNSIKTPWKRPRFPDPPTEFLAPEKFLELAKEAVLVHHTKINHPFCVKLFRGEWTVKQLHGWIKQEYHAVMQTLRNDANIVATPPPESALSNRVKIVERDVEIYRKQA